MNKYHSLTVERMPEGGFVVVEGQSRGDMSRYYGPLFACTSIGDALAFVRDKLQPPEQVAAAAAAPNGKITPPPHVRERP